jgi:hypothetical protein
MAQFTLQLRELESVEGREGLKEWFKDYDLHDYLTQKQIDLIEERGVWSKDKLADLIIDHYYMREIGVETVALFKRRVKVRMQEIMEDYLPVLYTASLQYDPLINVNYTETYTGENTSENTSTSETNADSNSSGLTVNSDTPQGQINKSAILGGSYASSTSANEIEDNATTTSNGTNTGTGTQVYTKHFEGNQGISATYQKMIQQYRENIRAIDREIIEELNTLFMSIY